MKCCRQRHYGCLRGIVLRVRSYDDGAGSKDEQERLVHMQKVVLLILSVHRLDFQSCEQASGAFQSRFKLPLVSNFNLCLLEKYLRCDGFITNCDSTFATVLHDICRSYVLQMRRNELKYGFYRQIPASFRRIYLSILHK